MCYGYMCDMYAMYVKYMLSMLSMLYMLSMHTHACKHLRTHAHIHGFGLCGAQTIQKEIRSMLCCLSKVFEAIIDQAVNELG